MRLSIVCIKLMLVLSVLGILAGAIVSCSQASGASLIKDLVIELPAVKKGESTQIECVTANGYGDELTYDWTATGGIILGTGPVVIWTAPDVYGKYAVTVTVMDESGCESSRELSINVTESG